MRCIGDRRFDGRLRRLIWFLDLDLSQIDGGCHRRLRLAVNRVPRPAEELGAAAHVVSTYAQIETLLL